MVLGRRHWIIVTIALILLMFLTACERPLSSSQSETAEQAAEATAVAETAQDEAAAESPAEAEAGSTAETEAGSTAETEAGSTAETGQAEAEGSAETAGEAESSDADVGGGTPETAASEAAAAGEGTEQASTGEDASAEVTTDEGATATDGETAEEATTGAETNAAAEGDATAEATAAETTESQAAEGEAEAVTAQEETATTATTLPATHTVAAGENLYRIGLKYGLSWVVLAAYNHLPNANYIRVGQVLQIPGGGTPSPTPTPTPPDESGHIDYVVQRGDTLNKIGLRYGVSWVEIAEANGLVNPNLIYAGQVLKIPTTAPDVPPAVTHTVKPGETLYRISLQYGVHWLAIAQANNIAPPYVIYPGQVLAIPGG